MQELPKRFSTLEFATIEIYGRMGKLQGTMKNLSKSGCFVELTKGAYVPKEGDLIHLTFALTSINKIRSVSGQVIWNRGVGFGIMFIRKMDVSKKILKNNYA